MSDLKDRLGSLGPAERKALLERFRGRSSSVSAADGRGRARPAFSIFFFGDQGGDRGLYDLVLKCARFADDHGFEAIWTPERHFHRFGGPYPNPSVLGAAIAAVTTRIQIRAGSVVAPLHHPLRLAEEWAVVDNISGGRTGIAFASGWQMQDFVLSPDTFEQRRACVVERLDRFKRLWRGESVPFAGPGGHVFDVVSHPRPVNPHPRIWLTAASNPETWITAARNGCGVLTGLMEQNVGELSQRIALYRDALAAAGYGRHDRPVTVMAHAFVGRTDDHARSLVKKPLTDYLSSHLNLYERSLEGQGKKLDAKSLSDKDKAELMELGFERYFSDSGLLGGVRKVEDMVRRLGSVGVDEIAALVNFGLAEADVMEGLERLAAVRDGIAG